ncbi:MAG: cupin domain-containing protein [Nitrospinota bacterium]
MVGKHDFIAINTEELEWQEDTDLMRLPKGIKVKVLSEDKELGRVDVLVKFPPGYEEPLHTHDSYHSLVVLDGTMCVAGKTLRRGDYVFGWDVEHGPYEYPDGCTVFAVFHGKSVAHEYEGRED